MGEIRVGTAGWTDRSLIASGWYPAEANNPEKRLRYYARQFPLVEVDATYYALPAEQTARAWAERTPDGFTFNIKAFSLFTQHPTPVRALPADLREAASQAGKERVYLKDVDPALTDQAWDRFLAALEPLRGAGQPGAGQPGLASPAPGSSARSCCSSRPGSRSPARTRTTSWPARSAPRRAGCAWSSATTPG